MSPDQMPHYKGPLAWMAQNSVAANLLMFIIFAGGLLSAFQIKQEVFPEFDLDMVTISVAYPGASPLDVEQGLVLVLEEAVRGIDGVKQVDSTSTEGAGVVTIELLADANSDRVLADIKSAVDRITSFPDEAEKPVVALAARRREVVSVIIAGDQELQTLHAIAEEAREQMLSHPDISQVDIEGVPPLELSIEIPREKLESYGLTLSQVAQQISLASLDLPGGVVETQAGQLLVRVSDRRLSEQQFAEIIIRGTMAGAMVRLGDLAVIRDDYEDTNEVSYFNGQPAVRLTIFRIGDETPKEVATGVKEIFAQLREKLPENISMIIWTDSSKRLDERIKLLMKNAALGLVLVLISLALLLRIRIAFWVAVGIPVTFMGCFIVLNVCGFSINMISLFGLIIALGMVVDDAIVVAENIFTKIQEGLPRKQAAIEGTLEMTVPVTFAVLTTVAAFMPLFLVPGIMGKIFFLIPVVVVSILLFSLLEVYFILPAHIAHGKNKKLGIILSRVEALRIIVSGRLEKFISDTYQPFLRRVVRYRYITISLSVSVLLVFIGIAVSGILPFNFFPDIEDDEVEVTARLPFGAPLQDVRNVQRILEQAAFEAMDDFGGKEVINGMFTQIGKTSGSMHGRSETGRHLVDIEVSLASLKKGSVAAHEFAAKWREKTPPIPGLEALIFNTNVGPSSGAAVDLQLSHSNTSVLAAASEDVALAMAGYEQLINIENTYAAGKPQFDFHLLPAGRTLGLTARDVAIQIRSAFYGAEAIREQRGRNELKVMVRLPEDQRSSEYDIEHMRIRTPGSGMVPLSYVARFDRARAPTDIRREDGKRIINVQAKLAPGVPSPRPILDSLMKDMVPGLKQKHPGLGVSLAGMHKDQEESFASLGENFFFALFVIFALLAIPLKSYMQPFIIMTAIPFGIAAALFGHILMGYNLSLMSVMGIVALAGVVVNDTLVLVVAANGYREDGKDACEAIIAAGMRRFRPILLTSLTTFFGLAPMIFESSIQAKFLIPMAISLGFGILFSLPVALLIVPAVYISMEDLINLKKDKQKPGRC